MLGDIPSNPVPLAFGDVPQPARRVGQCVPTGLNEHMLNDRCRTLPAGTLRFDEYLERNNERDRFGPEDASGMLARSAGPERDREPIRPFSLPPHLRPARLGDVSPIEAHKTTQEVRVVYRIIEPVRIGGLLDLLI